MENGDQQPEEGPNEVSQKERLVLSFNSAPSLLSALSLLPLLLLVTDSHIYIFAFRSPPDPNQKSSSSR